MICHASGETGPATVGTYAVILSVQDESAIHALSAILSEKGVDHHVVYEPDPPYLGQAMAIGLPPGDRCKALAGLPLYTHTKESLP